jgi:hypothetical protein
MEAKELRALFNLGHAVTVERRGMSYGG